MATHDPLCPWPMVCYCTIIGRVRADERARWSPPAPATPGHVAACWCDRCQMAEDAKWRQG
jgi:hypothetical protein